MGLKSKLIIAAQSVMIVGLLGAVMWLVYTREQQGEIVETARIVADEQTAVVNLDEDGHYRVTGDKIYLDMPGVGQMWLPVLADVPACERNAAQFVCRNGQQYYLDEQKITSKLGIDVSAYQGDIDWNAVKESGVDFAFIRCGFRGYGSGELVTDKYFDQNVQGAQAAGVNVGVYFYSQAVTREEAIEEAELTLSLIGDYKLTYPVVYDWETVPEDTARTDHIGVDDLTDCTIAFCDTIRAAGFIPMVYQNKRTSLLKLDLPRLQQYDFWLAEYNDQASYYYDYRIWQYCSDGYVPGIEGVVDMNICFAPYA